MTAVAEEYVPKVHGVGADGLSRCHASSGEPGSLLTSFDPREVTCQRCHKMASKRSHSRRRVKLALTLEEYEDVQAALYGHLLRLPNPVTSEWASDRDKRLGALYERMQKAMAK